MSHVLILLASFLISLTAQASWNLNDVSYLMPLPTKLDGNGLINLTTAGKGGVLLPEEFVKKMPELSNQRDSSQILKNLRVLGVRIDHCFPLPVPAACQRQIRLVWQPLEIGRNAQIQSVDAALHSFYVLTDEEFSQLLKDLQAWKTQYAVETEGLPLQVHPSWIADKDQSPALQDFNKIVLKYAGLANLSRVTVMVLRGMGDMWAFAGFAVENGNLKMIPIPRILKMSQAFVNQAVPADRFENAFVSPLPQGMDTFNTLMKNSKALESGQDELIRQEMKALYRIENPHNFNPENMDCVSCHVAQPARSWILKNRADLKIEDLWSQIRYQNLHHDLSNISPELGNTQMIRAFGYFGKDVSLSQRVINESAEVADAVSAYLQ